MNFDGERCGICMDVVIDRGVLDCCQHWYAYAENLTLCITFYNLEAFYSVISSANDASSVPLLQQFAIKFSLIYFSFLIISFNFLDETL